MTSRAILLTTTTWMLIAGCAPPAPAKPAPAEIAPPDAAHPASDPASTATGDAELLTPPRDPSLPLPGDPTSTTDAPDPSKISPPPSASQAPPAPPPPTPQPTAAEQKACAARGGKIQPVCMLGNLECVIRFRDGGKKCTDKKDCTGECLFEGSSPPPSGKGVGACQRTSDPCGCKTPIVGGKVQPGICVD